MVLLKGRKYEVTRRRPVFVLGSHTLENVKVITGIDHEGLRACNA